MSWKSILKKSFEVDEPLTEQMTWEGKDYFIYDRETNSATPNGVLYLYKTYHEPTGTLSYPIIKLYLDGNEIKEWTDEDQKEFDMEVEQYRFDVAPDAKSKDKFVEDNQ